MLQHRSNLGSGKRSLFANFLGVFLDGNHPRPLLLKNSFRGSYTWFGMEATLDGRVAQHIRGRDENHTLMVRHPVANDFVVISGADTRGSKVSSLIETKGRKPAELFHPANIFDRMHGIEKHPQKR